MDTSRSPLDEPFSPSVAGPLKPFFWFPFRDPAWVSRFLMATLLLMVNVILPGPTFIYTAGYLLQVMRQTIEGQEPTLPEWGSWSRLGTDGAQALFIVLLYLLPGGIAILIGLALFVAFVEGSQFLFSYPILLLLSMGVMSLAIPVGVFLLVLGAAPLPLAIAHFVARSNVNGAFRVREWWALLKAHPSGYFTGWVITGGLFFIYYTLIVVASFSFCLFPFFLLIFIPLTFYVGLVGAALFGHIYRESVVYLGRENHQGGTSRFVEFTQPAA